MTEFAPTPRVCRGLAVLLAFALVLPALVLPGVTEAGDRPLGFVDLMKIQVLGDPVISDDGAWIAYDLEPDRGDGSAVVRSTSRSTSGNTEYTVERGHSPEFSSDSRWAVVPRAVSFADEKRAEDEKLEGDDAPQPGLVLLAIADGDGAETSFERVKAHALSDDGRWLAVHHHGKKNDDTSDEAGEEGSEGESEETEGEEEPGLELPEPPTEPAPGEEPTAEEPQEEEPTEPTEPGDEPEDRRTGSPLTLRHLPSGTEIAVDDVESFVFDHGSRFLAYTVAEATGEDNGLFVVRLGSVDEATTARSVRLDARGRYTSLAVPEGVGGTPMLLAYVAAIDDEDGEPGDGTVEVWDGTLETRQPIQVAATDTAPDGWYVPSTNELTWSRDGERLFLGLKPERERPEPDEDEAEDEESEDAEPPADPFDTEEILAERTVDVWHWNDPLIVTNQREEWEDEKDRIYLAVWHRGDSSLVPLADQEVRMVEPTDDAEAVLGAADVPYLKERTWDGWYFDIYRVSLADGSRQRVAERVGNSAALSPDGRWVVWFADPVWRLYDATTGETVDLTGSLSVPFADEDHDYPQDPPGYGLAGWVQGADRDGDRTAAVLLNDKFDVWQFPLTSDEAPFRLTDGRSSAVIHRVLDTSDDDEESYRFAPGERLLLSTESERAKWFGLGRAQVGAETAATSLLQGDYKVTYRDTAEGTHAADDAPRHLYTRERYTEFPDLWVAGDDFDDPRKLSDANPQIADFAWGEAELVEWESSRGVPLQGVLIKPGNYVEGERYPVMVYYYRFFSQRLHEFNDPRVNHRPSFPVYASRDYAVFLPDIRFEVGRPGMSAVEALVPGVQKLVEMGLADPDAIGLHGHSWSGYQTAFVVTQTNAFAAAVAGAPVTNMTSAYGGIRYGSGLSRMFQYEKSQSRIGVSMWDDLDAYIENSPVFYADRIQTPLLIMFGDQDDAVPWTQGVELYMAMRRLGKEAVFLQYRGEPHHPRIDGNKLDYSIKMLEFFDHYLKGEPAPEWLAEGVPYRGDD